MIQLINLELQILLENTQSIAFMQGCVQKFQTSKLNKTWYFLFLQNQNFIISLFWVSQKRRERISERLRILQKLIPNGTKVSFSVQLTYIGKNLCILRKLTRSNVILCNPLQVDISTMLEEAYQYVKFLQLQIKVCM